MSGSYTNEAPEPFQGGILADDMGLGKTLSMMSLIAANQACNSLSSPPIESNADNQRWMPAAKTTLLIVPPARKHDYLPLPQLRSICIGYKRMGGTVQGIRVSPGRRSRVDVHLLSELTTVQSSAPRVLECLRLARAKARRRGFPPPI